MSFFKKLFGKGKENSKSVNETEQNDVVQEHDVNVQEEAGEQHTREASQEEVKSLEEEGQVAETKVDKQEVVNHEQNVQTARAEEVEEKTEEIEEVHEVVTETATEESEELKSQASEQVEETLVQEEITQEENLIEEESPVQEEEVPHKKQGFIKRLFSGLAKTRDNILKGVDEVLSNFKNIDEELYEELEEALIMADFGVDTTLLIMDRLRKKVKEDKITDPSLLKGTLQEIIRDMLMGQPDTSLLNENGPTVILVIGVNGVGKTTSIGKMAHSFKAQGKKVLIAAADTFRAAAIEQLQVWADRAGADIIKHAEGSDAAAVVFDAIAAAKSRKVDVLICDTAGRLQNKTNLMRELEKISRIIEREYPEAKKEILIALDATTGQNAIQQVKLFKEVAAISGIILTKLDGTAKGGAIVGIYENLQVPVKFIGVGEKIDDLQPFDAQSFADALFQTK